MKNFTEKITRKTKKKINPFNQQINRFVVQWKENVEENINCLANEQKKEVSYCYTADWSDFFTTESLNKRFLHITRAH